MILPVPAASAASPGQQCKAMLHSPFVGARTVSTGAYLTLGPAGMLRMAVLDT